MFPWAANARNTDVMVRQGLMRALVYHWRDMELMGNTTCLEALQRIPFISTVGGSIMSAVDMLDPTVEKLRALYGPGDVPGPFPDSRWLSAECRAVLHYRTELSYQEISERLGFLHQIETERRRALEASGSNATLQASLEVRAVAMALVRYVCDDVCTAMRDGEVDVGKQKEERPRQSEGGFWQALDFVGMLSGPAEAAKPAKKAAKLSPDELMSIQSKLKRCYWLAPLPRPDGWPLDAPWRGSECGLCSSEEAGVPLAFVPPGSAVRGAFGFRGVLGWHGGEVQCEV